MREFNVNSNILATDNELADNADLVNQDPYEFNRHAYKLNTAVDKAIIRPVACI